MCLVEHAPHCLQAAAGMGNGCTARAAWLAAEYILLLLFRTLTSFRTQCPQQTCLSDTQRHTAFGMRPEPLVLY